MLASPLLHRREAEGQAEAEEADVGGRGLRREGVPKKKGCLEREEPEDRVLVPTEHTYTHAQTHTAPSPSALAPRHPRCIARHQGEPTYSPTHRETGSEPQRRRAGRRSPTPPSPAASPRGASHPPRPRCGSRTVGSSGSICAPWSWVSMRRRGRGGALPAARARSPGAAGLRRAPRAAALPPRIRWRGGRKRAPVTWPRAPPAPVRGETGAGSTCGMRPDPTAAASPRRAGEGGRTSPLHGCACKPAPEHVGGIGSSRRPFPSAGAVQSAPPTAERAPCPERKERREGPDRKHRPASDTIANIKTRPASYNFTPGLRHRPPETVASVQFWAKIRFDFISIRRALKNRDPLLGPTRLSPLDPHSIFKIEVCPILH